MEIYVRGLKEFQSVSVQMKHYCFPQTQLHCLAYCNMCLVLPVPRVNQFLWNLCTCVIRLFIFLDSLPQTLQGNGPHNSPWMLDTCDRSELLHANVLSQKLQENLFCLLSRVTFNDDFRRFLTTGNDVMDMDSPVSKNKTSILNL